MSNRQARRYRKQKALSIRRMVWQGALENPDSDAVKAALARRPEMTLEKLKEFKAVPGFAW